LSHLVALLFLGQMVFVVNTLADSDIEGHLVLHARVLHLLTILFDKRLLPARLAGDERRVLVAMSA